MTKLPADVTASYDYVPQYYSVPSTREASFARAEATGAVVAGGRTAIRFTLSKRWIERVGPWDARSLGLGGWSLSVHHAYDPDSRTLLLGDGRQRRAETLPLIITTV